MNDIKINDLFVRHRPKLPDVFENLSFDFTPDEFTYVAGKSRVGKTTLMRVLGGLVPSIMGQICGDVKVFGEDPINSDLGKYCENIRYIGPDPYASIHGLTVGQEIMLMAKDEKKAHEVLKIMGIDHLWDRETDTLSGGEGIRLVLAGALVSTAKVLLLDSPMQELDPQGRKDFLSALTLMREDFNGYIFISDPYWEELEKFIDKVLVIENKWRVNDGISTQSFFSSYWLKRTGLFKQFPSFDKQPLGKEVAKMENVHVYLSDNHILKGFDFSVREGELVVIAGKNGSGKTTAMLTLANAIKCSEGSVSTQGKVSYVFQHPKLQTVAMTIDKELELEPKLLGWDEEKTEKFKKEALEWLGLDSQLCPLDLHPADRRLLMIAASSHSPILVLDEPTIDLDAGDTLKVLKFIQNQREKGVAVVLITHDPAIMNLADRVVVVEDGRVVNEYIPQEVLIEKPEYVSHI